MLKPISNPRTLSPVFLFLFLFTLVLTFLFAFPWVNAQEPPKPKPWQIDGIMAAKDDEHDQVKGYAFRQFSGYKPQDLKSVVKKPEDIARKAVTILKDESVDKYVRSSAARALGNLGETAQPHVKDIATILKDESVDQYVRSSAAYALGNLGEPAQPLVKEIATILKDESVDEDVRGSAA
ncbi:MAG: HEAT repeat domain-containing protein, partial [Coleofasciculus sp. C2-GNP5-27]